MATRNYAIFYGKNYNFANRKSKFKVFYLGSAFKEKKYFFDLLKSFLIGFKIFIDTLYLKWKEKSLNPSLFYILIQNVLNNLL